MPEASASGNHPVTAVSLVFQRKRLDQSHRRDIRRQFFNARHLSIVGAFNIANLQLIHFVHSSFPVVFFVQQLFEFRLNFFASCKTVWR